MVGVSKALYNCTHIPNLGEVCMYQYDQIHDLWDMRIGDGKTQVKNLLSVYDIYKKIANIENELIAIKAKIC